jgi:hypothetical protein
MLSGTAARRLRTVSGITTDAAFPFRQPINRCEPISSSMVLGNTPATVPYSLLTAE